MLATVEVLWHPKYAEVCFKLNEKQFDLKPLTAQSIFDEMNRGELKYRDLSDPKFDFIDPSESTMRPVHKYLRGMGYACRYHGLILLEEGITLGVKGMYTDASRVPCLPAPSGA